MTAPKKPTKRTAVAASLPAPPLELTAVELRLLQAYRFTDDRGQHTIYMCALRQEDYPRHPAPLLRLITGGTK